MSLLEQTLPNSVGLRLHGLNPLSMSEAEASELRQCFHNNSILLIRDVELTPESHIALSRALGEPEIHPMADTRLPGFPEIVIPEAYSPGRSDNPDEIVGQLPWHADLTYTTTPPMGALLRAIEIPAKGGQTGFVDSAAVYASLDKKLQQQLETLYAVHSIARGQRLLGFDIGDDAEANLKKQFPPVIQPMVLREPITGTPALNISPLFAERILAPDNAVGETVVLEDLVEHACSDRFVYWHEWQTDDLVIWNNYRTLHSAAGHPQKMSRTMHRTTIKGLAATGELL